MVDDQGELINGPKPKKPTDLDLRKLKERYISRETIISILDAARTFNGAQ